MTREGVSAFVSWPGAPLTNRLVVSALDHIGLGSSLITQTPTNSSEDKLVQWATYDAIDHDLTHQRPSYVLSSSYVFRKALIRKHYLSRCIHSYLVKHPESVLSSVAPQTWELELSFVDELDDMWADELWDLGEALENEGGKRWFILKPGMADRGQGIRLFNSKDALQQIFEGFEEDSCDEDDQAGRDSTAVMTSQLRHFVIQEYLDTPLLVDPRSTLSPPEVEKLEGHKFHLRVYCVATGAMCLYMYTRILALFSSKAYESPQSGDGNEVANVDLAPHLTNTSLQANKGEEGVRLLDELVGLKILSRSGDRTDLSEEHLQAIHAQMAEALAETFKAALATPIHFQPAPNAFELYGIDFLVSDETPSGASTPYFQVKLLEINAEPAIELTGPRLTWILEDLFKSIAEVAVLPFLEPGKTEDWAVGETKHHLRKCLDTEVRGAAGW
ncbi:unnamed protein product [Peniophora sp. CBMAI 1063]|nr:unnamed protein product [Peniophora sp. CBMAI 1063]